MAFKYKRPRGRPPKGINPRTGQKKAPPRTRKDKAYKVSRNPDGNPNFGFIVQSIWDDPDKRSAFLELRREAFEAKTKRILDRWTRFGIPNGMRRKQAEHAWNFARMYANEVAKIMKDEGLLPEDPKVEKAFKAAVEVLEGPMSQGIKLQAARLILDFCKAKPVAKSEVTVKSAEDWLQQVTADHLKKTEGEN